MHSPLHQFEIHTLFPLTLFGQNISFTNSSLWMVIASLVLCGFGYSAAKHDTLIPKRIPYLFECLYNFIASLVKTNVGREGRKYFPYIFSLFLFILTTNLMGMLPYSFTVTSHIAVTFTLALLVFIGATLVGIIKHKMRFFRLFFPEGAPLFVAPILIPIEIISYCSRPISLGARLFANMVAGHVMIKIFAGFVGMLLATPLAAIGILPILLNTLLTGFEIMIAILQAYVFTILTCIYLNDALNLH